MFSVIYRGFVPLHNQVEYRRLWKQIADYFISNRGAIGSRLHIAADGSFLAYSCWPDKQTRDASWPGDEISNDVLPTEIRSAIVNIKSLSSEPFEEIQMEVLEDKL